MSTGVVVVSSHLKRIGLDVFEGLYSITTSAAFVESGSVAVDKLLDGQIHGSVFLLDCNGTSDSVGGSMSPAGATVDGPVGARVQTLVFDGVHLAVLSPVPAVSKSQLL